MHSFEINVFYECLFESELGYLTLVEQETQFLLKCLNNEN